MFGSMGEPLALQAEEPEFDPPSPYKSNAGDFWSSLVS